MARRIAIDNARRRREYANGSAGDIDRLSSRTAVSPEDVVVANEGVGLIRKALRSLPSRYRDALVTYSEHRDNSAVAARLGVSDNAVGSLLCRARMRLREELDRVGYAASALAFRFHRVSDIAATATAAVCFVAVIGGTSGAATGTSASSATGAPASLVAAAVAAPLPHPKESAIRPRAGRAVAAGPVDELAKQVEIVRYEVEACTRTGRRIRTPYVSVVREGRKSVTGYVASRLSQPSKITTGTCR